MIQLPSIKDRSSHCDVSQAGLSAYLYTSRVCKTRFSEEPMKRLSIKVSGMFSLCCGVLLLLMCSANVFAQGTSSVTGSVVDPQGNVIAGATITLSNAEKNFTRTQTTTEGGLFAFNLIPPGQYKLESEAKGFKKA